MELFSFHIQYLGIRARVMLTWRVLDLMSFVNWYLEQSNHVTLYKSKVDR